MIDAFKGTPIVNVSRSRCGRRLIMLLPSTLLTMTTMASEVTVQPGDDLQAVLDNSQDGDVVVFSPGRYEIATPLQIQEKSIRLQGLPRSPRGAIELAGTSSGRLLVILNGDAGGTVELAEVTFSNSPDSNGAGILVTGGSLLIDDCIFEGHRVVGDSGGAALRAIDSDIEISDSRFAGNSCLGGPGGAIKITGGSLQVVESAFENNGTSIDYRHFGGGGGGGIFADTCEISIASCWFNRNHSISGGGMTLKDATWSVHDSLFTSCSSVFSIGARESSLTPGGGISAFRSSGTCSDCQFEGNLGRGGGIGITSGFAQLEDCLFLENESLIVQSCSLCRDGAGGALFASDGADTVADRCYFLRNLALDGGAIQLENATIELTACTIWGNFASCAYSPGMGGGVSAKGSLVRLTDTVLLQNEAPLGGGISAESSQLELTRCELLENKCGGCTFDSPQPSGAAIMARDCDGFLLDCNVSRNCAESGADSIHTDSMLLFANSRSCASCSANFVGEVTLLGDSEVADSCSVSCPADLNGDGEVGPADLGLFLAMVHPEGCSPWGTCSADLNQDSEIDGSDLGELLLAWGTCR
jgi:hypothetical protein